jgi:AcrR family transcriptional regulator
MYTIEMPRASLSPEQIDDFRERLVTAASRLFARRGYDGVTLRAIAAELGCSPMTPYRYFRDKAEIFAAVRTAAFQGLAASQEACCDESQPPLAVLAALGRGYVRYALEQPDAYRLMFELGQTEPERFPELWAASQRSIAPLRTWIGRCVDAGQIAGDPDLLTHVFWSAVHGIASLHLAGKLAFGCSIEDLIGPVLQTLLRGNQPTSPSGAPHPGDTP